MPENLRPKRDFASNSVPLDPEVLWAAILSADPGRTMRAYDSLPPDDQQQVLAHLRRMAQEPDWQASQRDAARAALRAVESQQPPAEDG